MGIKHLVRYIFRKRGLTYREISEAEGEITGRKPHHTTLMNSIDRIENG